MKKAFICGINLYPGSPLMGCVNDANNMYGMLTDTFGFDPANVRVLVDGRATTAEMKARLDWLVTGAQPDDVLVFHYSGHGSQIVDRGEQDELSDHLDEIICPVDLDWGQKLISDDDLGDFLSRVPAGAFAYVILDSCNSGTGTRLLTSASQAEDTPIKQGYKRNRYMIPPLDIYARSMKTEAKIPRRKIGRGKPLEGVKFSRRKGRTRSNAPRGCLGFMVPGVPAPTPDPTPNPGPGGEVPVVQPVPELNHILLSGCQSYETSADAFVNGTYQGAMTWALTTSMKKLGPGASVNSVYAELMKTIQGGGFDQHPQLEGPEGMILRPLFS